MVYIVSSNINSDNINMAIIQIKRAYDPASATDGYRVYIDRLWPRGLSHDTFYYDLWDKDIAPSASLREWFHADRDSRWDEFKRRYTEELSENPAFNHLESIIEGKTMVTLLYSSHDKEHNNAVVVEALLSSKGQSFQCI
jgi:uncharacterized protein YeaO (DUF488 family)